MSAFVRCEVTGVMLDQSVPAPMLRLREIGGRERELDIHIGAPEAASIHAALEGVEMPRPLTHDLFVESLRRLEVVIARIAVTEIVDSTFHAVMTLEAGRGVHQISCRPSDAVAIALRAGVDVEVADDLLESHGRPAPADDREILEEFKDFIEGVRPEDFGA